MKRLRLYADTSVFGGCFDEEFRVSSCRLFEEIRRGLYDLVLSPTTLRELSRAPEQVRRILASIPEGNLEVTEASDEVDGLRDAYLEAGILGAASAADAEHIASASVADVDLIVSWNFKHIVHFDKIREYHAVNLVHGYRALPIHTPQEVVSDDEEGI